MGLPKVMQVKLEALKAMENNPAFVKEQETNPVMVSFDKPPAPILENNLEVDTNPADTGEQENSNNVVDIDTNVDWKAEAQKNHQRWSTLHGTNEKLRQDNEFLKKSMEELKTSFETFKNTPVKVAEPDLSEELTAEEKAVYGEAAPVIEKISKRIARQLAETMTVPLKQEIVELKNSHGQFSKSLKDTSDSAFYAMATSRIPNFEGIINSQEWKDHLLDKVPYSKSTIGELLKNAHDNRELDTIEEIFEKFSGSAKKTAPAKTSNISSMSAPNISSAAGSSGIKQKPNFKMSARVKAHADFTKGRISKEQLAQINNEYNQAVQEGRVEEDIPLRGRR